MDKDNNNLDIAQLQEEPVLEEKTKKLVGTNVFDAFVEVFENPSNLEGGKYELKKFASIEYHR